MSTIANRVTREIVSHCQLIRPTTLTITLLGSARWTPRFVSGLLRPFTTTAIVVDRTRIPTTSSSTTEKPPVKEFSPNFRIQTPWTKEENELLESKIREGLSTPDFHTDFPRRSVSALATQLHKLQTIMKAKDQEKGIDSNYLKMSKRAKSWTTVEDVMLIQLVQVQQEQRSRLPQQQGAPGENIDWTLVAETKLNGERLGRTSSSCQRRWDTLDPMKNRGEGAWREEEEKLFMKALGLQLPAIKKEITGAADLAGLNLKSIDYNEISRVVGTRGSTRCRSHLYSCLLSRNRGRWTPEEKEKLQEGMRQHGRDWAKLEEAVGTRSVHQIKKKVLYNIAK